MSEVVFPNQSFADDVGVCQGCDWMGGKVFEVGGFVGGDLQYWRRWAGQLRHGSDGVPKGCWKLRLQSLKNQGLDIVVFVANKSVKDRRSRICDIVDNGSRQWKAVRAYIGREIAFEKDQLSVQNFSIYAI